MYTRAFWTQEIGRGSDIETSDDGLFGKSHSTFARLTDKERIVPARRAWWLALWAMCINVTPAVIGISVNGAASEAADRSAGN